MLVFHSYFTTPGMSEKSVKSRPVPTFLPAWIVEPTCRTMMLPATHGRAGVDLHAALLSLGIAAVTRGAAAFFMSHGIVASANYALMPVIFSSV